MTKLPGRGWEHGGGGEVGIRGDRVEKGEGEDGESLREWDGCDEGGVDVGAGKYISKHLIYPNGSSMVCRKKSKDKRHKTNMSFCLWKQKEAWCVWWGEKSHGKDIYLTRRKKKQNIELLIINKGTKSNTHF